MTDRLVYLARKTTIEMLTDRGLDTSRIVKHVPFRMFKSYLEFWDNDSGVLDVQCDGSIVRFVKNVESARAAGATPTSFTPPQQSGQPHTLTSKEAVRAKKELLRLEDTIRRVFSPDTIIFVLCYGSEVPELLQEYEQDNSSVQVFHVSQLVFNITHHTLVPKHEIVPRMEVQRLKRKLNIGSLQQLPQIQGTDPVARYLNLKHNDVVRIYRPSNTTLCHICYRACVSTRQHTDESNENGVQKRSTNTLESARTSSQEPDEADQPERPEESGQMEPFEQTPEHKSRQSKDSPDDETDSQNNPNDQEKQSVHESVPADGDKQEYGDKDAVQKEEASEVEQSPPPAAQVFDAPTQEVTQSSVDVDTSSLVDLDKVQTASPLVQTSNNSKETSEPAGGSEQAGGVQSPGQESAATLPKTTVPQSNIKQIVLNYNNDTA